MMQQTIPAATLNQAWSSYWSNLFNFSGRSTRAEYWWIMLIVITFNAVATLPLLILPAVGSMLLSIAVAVLTLALYVRRFHDAGFPTWAAVTSVVGQLVLSTAGLALLLLGFLPSVTGETFNPENMRGGLLIIGGLLILAALAVNIFVLIVTLLPSQRPNRYGPQRAGKVALGELEAGGGAH